MEVQEAEGRGSAQVAESRQRVQGAAEEAQRNVAWVRLAEQKKHEARLVEQEGQREVHIPSVYHC